MGGTSNFLELLKTSLASFLTGSFPWKTLLTFDISIFVKTIKISYSKKYFYVFYIFILRPRMGRKILFQKLKILTSIFWYE